MKTFIDEQVATKGYGNVSEYFRSLLRDARERDEGTRLEALLLEGLATGGDDIPLTRAFWKDLKTEALDLAKKHKKGKRVREAHHQASGERRHHPAVPVLVVCGERNNEDAL